MTRSIFALVASSIVVIVMLGAGGCTASGIGDPCTPEQEYDPSFTGFNAGEVNVESRSFQCQTRLCLVNHFQGRVSCPYGQAVDGTPYPPAKNCATGTPGANAGCCIPGVNQPVTGNDPSGMPLDPINKAKVRAQCLDRTAAEAVYCSCRCANVNGDTNDGANYCTCPTGFKCEQLVGTIGASTAGLAGAYCVKNNTDYDKNMSCTGAICDPTLANCGPVQ